MTDRTDQTPVPRLDQAPGQREAWTRPRRVLYAWAVVERLLLTNHLQPSSGLRRRVLRGFGANVGEGVILRPGLRVKFPWNLEIGDRSWIGEDVWIHNQTQVTIGRDAVVSQDTFITTGTHAFRGDMALVMRPVTIEDGAWVTSRCVVLAGTHVGRSALVTPNTVASGDIPPNTIFGSERAQVLGTRFPDEGTGPPQD